jgi:hypothetical protein
LADLRAVPPARQWIDSIIIMWNQWVCLAQISTTCIRTCRCRWVVWSLHALGQDIVRSILLIDLLQYAWRANNVHVLLLVKYSKQSSYIANLIPNRGHWGPSAMIFYRDNNVGSCMHRKSLRHSISIQKCSARKSKNTIFSRHCRPAL